MIKYLKPIYYTVLQMLLSLMLLTGCISLPLSTDTQESELNGYVDGQKSNPDEKIVVVASSTVWHFIGLAAHPPMPSIDHDSTSYSYFLEKNGERKELYFLNRENAANVRNVNNQWFSFEIDGDSEYFRVIQFGFNKFHEKHKIPITLAGAISELYIDKEATVLVWREVNLGYHEYNIEEEEMTRRFYSPGKFEIEALLKVPISDSEYVELTFHEAIESGKSDGEEYNPLMLVETESIEMLKKASLSKNYIVRWAVVINQHSPKNIIEKLKNDNSYYVASAAQKRLASQK